MLKEYNKLESSFFVCYRLWWTKTDQYFVRQHKEVADSNSLSLFTYAQGVRLLYNLVCSRLAGQSILSLLKVVFNQKLQRLNSYSRLRLRETLQ